MCGYYPKSKVELSGFAAKHYDQLMNAIPLIRYSSFIQKAIQLMRIHPDDRIVDFGSGTGRNACLMMEYLSARGKLTGLDISADMNIQFKKKCAGMDNAEIVNRRIDKPLNYENEFDKVFISFVLHGFPQEVRIQIIKNAFKALKKQGDFFILDYNEFLINEMPLWLRLPFKFIECPYAFDFIKKDWQNILTEEGFNGFEKHLFLNGYVRLLKAKKMS